MMCKAFNRLIILILLALVSSNIHAADRFPRPDFESGYSRPEINTPTPRAELWQYTDIAALIITLSIAAWMVYKKRSRKGTLLLSALSLAYFGFFRNGCVCSVGSLQNVSLALFDNSYAIPLVIIAFFALPIISALFFGRIFCGSVCPLGAAQEVVLVNPVKIPHTIDKVLRFGPWVFLGATILFAATNTSFLICEHDPFVSFFRLSGSSTALITGSVILATSTIIGRPYCRYMCPYGAILSVFSRLSWRRITITPDKCINCRLCENACPYGAIKAPNTERLGNRITRERVIMIILLVLVPALALAGGWAGYLFHNKLAQKNPAVKTAQIVQMSQGNVKLSTDQREISESFFQTHTPPEKLYAEAETVRKSYAVGTTIMGGFLGFLAALGLIRLSIWRKQNDYEADRGNCLACGRCYSSCPRQIILRKEQADS